MDEMNFLKQQLSSQSSEFSFEANKFIQEKDKLHVHYSD